MSFNDTAIRWADKNHNATWGCSKTGSPGCANCYAEEISTKFGHTDRPWLEVFAEENVTIKRHYLDDQLGKPAWVFVNSMSDMYHPQIPDDFIHDYYDRVCRRYDDSAFLILTKHGADNDRDIGHPPDNVLLGVSVGHPDWRYRIDWLRKQPAATKFVSFEPLIDCIPDVNLSSIDWAIIGGESGPGYREMDPAWARNLIRSCRRQEVAVFFKQHSDRVTETRQAIEYDGQEQHIEEFPELPNGIVPAPQEFLVAADGGRR